jgi:hypothetical protein
MELALEQLGQTLGEDAMVQKVEGMRAGALRGVTTTPAVAVNGRIVSQGRIPNIDGAKRWIQAASWPRAPFPQVTRPAKLPGTSGASGCTPHRPTA